MSEENFTKLGVLAREQFGGEIVRSEKPSNFKEVFGFDVEDLKSKIYEKQGLISLRDKRKARES